MGSAAPLIGHISDTALWAAAFRSRETQREDALFRDPFAAALAGQRGLEIADALSTPTNSVSWITRTFLFDRFISKKVDEGVDLVLNLGAGLDARPYRMKLPASLQWVEVDAPHILAYKQKLLSGEKPSCGLERVGLDLLDHKKRGALLSKIASRGKKILVITEGLLIYLNPEEVSGLAGDLSRQPHFESWILEIVSPPVLENMRQSAGREIQQAGSSFLFAPDEGPAFFERHGWKVTNVNSVLKTAVLLGRTPIDPKFACAIPDLSANSLPWIGVCLLQSQQLL
jgi:methyltransferase (TIGR00027 family)